MKKVLLVLVLLFFCVGDVIASENIIRISGFNYSRSLSPLFDYDGDPFYISLLSNIATTRTVGSLLNDSLFDPDDLVNCSVSSVVPVDYVVNGSLINADGQRNLDVFFLSPTTQELSNEEIEELVRFVNRGGVLFIGVTSCESTLVNLNTLLLELGLNDSFGSVYTNVSSGVITQNPVVLTDITNGVFGLVGPVKYGKFRAINVTGDAGVYLDEVNGRYLISEYSVGDGYVVVAGMSIYVDLISTANNVKYFRNLVAMGCKEDTSNNAVVLDVPSLKQYEEPWGSDEYDSAVVNNLGCGQSIKDCGCALTSATMVMNYYGFGQDPGQVNTDFKSSDWYWQGNFNWWVVGDYAGLSRPSWGYFDEEIIKEYIDGQIPVAVKVRADFTDQHWVVVKGYDDAGLIINDPLFPDPPSGYVHLGDRGYEVFDDGKGVVLYGSVQAPALAMLEGSTPGWFEIFSDTEVSVSKDGLEVGDYFKVGEGDYLGREGNVRVVQPAVEGSYSVEVEPDEMGICDYTIFSSSRDGGIERWDFSNCGGEFWFHGDGGLVVNIGIDVRPANEKNFVNGASHSVFPVAILGSEDLSVFEINKYSLELEGAMIYRPNQKTQLRDVNKDGYLDMVVWFERVGMDYLFGGGEACLRGEFKDGLGLMGCDEIKMLPQGLR